MKTLPISARLAFGLLFISFFSFQTRRPAAQGPCTPRAEVFDGYSFLHPDIININAAYAPYFVRWDDYYARYYHSIDYQKKENVEEWIGRFCEQPTPEDVEIVVYKSSVNDLGYLREMAEQKDKKTPLPYGLGGNTFAQMLVENGCVETIEYLMYARKCEPHVTTFANSWRIPDRDPETMQELIDEGISRFKACSSHFLRLRYAYQAVRLAHYKRDWQQTVDVFNQLMPQVDRRRPSAIFFWTLGHVAGALQQMGRYPEAAYRFALIFRFCAGKREQAYRSFIIRNDADWEKTMLLCQNDAERSTLYVLRSGISHTYSAEDVERVYELDPGNPQLPLLLVSDVQELEKIFLRTPVTEKKRGKAKSAMQRETASQQLLQLQQLVRKALKEEKVDNLRLWQCIDGYLELLAGDLYAAEKTFDRIERKLDEGDDYDQKVRTQLEIWRLLLQILQLDSDGKFADDEAFRIRSYAAFKAHPDFDPFMQDWLSDRYAAANRPGKAVLSAYEPRAIFFNPTLAVVDDLLRAAGEQNADFLQMTMALDTTPERVAARLHELKGAYLFSVGQPEAALVALRNIPLGQRTGMTKFTPFKEVLHDKINRPVTDSLLLNRLEIMEKLFDFELKAKAAAATDAPEAAWYYYLLGLGYYNMSYFGYEWEAMDFYRSGYNWLRLSQGPIFPLAGSPSGNRENTDVSIALGYFERALSAAKNPEMAARAAFMAARCRQKQWFTSIDCKYKPGSKLIPVIPDAYNQYYTLLLQRYRNTAFFQEAVKECKWLAAYAR